MLGKFVHANRGSGKKNFIESGGPSHASSVCPEANTTPEIGTGLDLVGPYGPYRLWLPNGWFDRSVFHLGDSDSQEET